MPSRPRWKKWGRNLVLSIAGTTFALLLLEVGLRVIAPRNPDFFDDSMFRRNYWEYIPNASSKRYLGLPVRINNLGYRGDEVAIPKPPRTFRIVGVGDSIAFGYGVRNEETFLEVLENGLNREAPERWRYETVNASVVGTQMDYYEFFVRQRAARLQPDLLLVGTALNDVDDYGAAAETEPPPGPMGKPSDYFLFHHSQLYAGTYVKVKSILYGLGVLDINKLHGYDYKALLPPSPSQQKAWDSSLAILERIVNAARNQHMKLALVIFPMEQQISAEALEFYRKRFHLKLGDEALSGRPQQILREFAASQGIGFVDLLPDFRAARSNALFLRNVSVSYDPVHPSALGHRIAGEAILREIAALTRVQPD